MKTKFPENQLVYNKIETAVLVGDIAIDSLAYRTQDLKINVDRLKVEDVHYWDFLMNDKIIVVENIHLDSPKIIRYKTKEGKQNHSESEVKKPILVSSFDIKNGMYISMTNRKDTLLFVKNFSAKIDSLKINSETVSQKIPFEYAAYSFQTDSLYFARNEYHALRSGKILISNQRVLVQNISMKPKYSRTEFRARIPYEKDMYRLHIDSLSIQNPSFGFRDKHPVFKSPLLLIDGVNFKIYRDKTVPDDPRTKKMYSEMLRDLHVKLDIQKTKLQHAFIQYQERIQKNRSLGTVAFYHLNAVITNITNMHLDSKNFPKTKLDIHASFMNTSDLDVNWQFDVSNHREYFTISGAVKNVPPKAMNSFFVPAMQIKAAGNIDAVYFDFRGAQVDAIGTMKMNYDNFSVAVLKKNGEEKNKLLSAIVNLFVKNDPKNGTVVKKGIEVKRDPTKSFWNYFWSMIEKGLLKSVL